MLLHAALGLALFETLALAAVLLAWADKVAGGRLLAAFLAGVAVWITGNELPNWFGPSVEPVALRLLATAPLTSAAFFHFCVVFCRAPLGPAVLRAGYGLALVATAVSQVLLPAHFVDHPVVGRLAWAETTAWVTSISWAVLGVGGVTLLVRALARAERGRRAPLAAVTASCLWGLVCLSGYGMALLRWPIEYPVPLLALPLYPVMLVYGVLRYGVVVSNAWAGRALVWTLLLALGAGAMALLPLLLPFESRWLNGVVVAALCLALNGPVRGFAHRLIYPGGQVNAQDLGAWRQALSAAEDHPGLAALASRLLSERLGTPVQVHVAAEAPTETRLPCLWMQRRPEGWAPVLQAWDAAPPGQRHVAELFATVLADAAQQVEQLQQLAARERERQLQARLAELGALAASVAHDIRNPLNIISMAVALAPRETRTEVATQVERIAHLTRDLLDYAKPWKLQPDRFDLRLLAEQLCAREAGARLSERWPATLPVLLDRRRLEQALINLIENARGATPEGCVIDIEQEAAVLRLLVCDNGPGVPADLRERLFEPFASRSKGGTGLGLAIVARVAQAHGGRAHLTEQPGWRTCFAMELPQ